MPVYMRKLMLLNCIKVLSLLALFLMVASKSVSAAEYYTWVDDDGVTNYSQRDPEGYKAEYITESQRRFGREQFDPPPPSEASTPAATSTGNVNADAAVADEKAAIAQELAKVKQDNCRIGTQNLARLESYSRIKVRDDDGEERFLNDDEKAQRTDEARALIRDNCTG